MGARPSKPVASFESAKFALCKSETELLAIFDVWAKASNLPDKVSSEVFLHRLGRDTSQFGVAVENRLFEVLGADNNALAFEEFVIAYYLFSEHVSQRNRLKVVFNMFDVSGSGSIKKKEFQMMTMSMIKGDMEDEGSFESQFKQLSAVMIDSAMVLYDVNRDGRLSFDEWTVFARENESVQAFLRMLAKPNALAAAAAVASS